MSEHEISQILKAAAPGEPAMRNLGDKVRSGVRRRRVAQSAVAVVGVLALAVPVALQLGGADRGEPNIRTSPMPAETPTVSPTDDATDPGPGPSQRPDATHVPAPLDPLPSDLLPAGRVSEMCSNAKGAVTPLVDALIPEGAVRLHLCAGDEVTSVPVFGPAEALAGFDELVADVNEAHLVHDLGTCEREGDGVVSYKVVLEYGDGSRVHLDGNTADCAGVTLGDDGSSRGSGAAFFDAVRQAFREQRANHQYSPDFVDAPCLYARSLMTSDVADMRFGSACGVNPASDSPEEQVIRHVIPEAVVAEIVDEVALNATEAPGQGLPLFAQTLILETAHGDPMTLYRWPDGSYFYPTETVWMEWMPSEELATELAFHFEGMRTEMFPEDLDVDLCMDPNLLLNEDPLAAATGAELCRQGDGQGIYDTVTVPVEIVDGLAAVLESTSETVDRYTEFTFTNHWVAMVAPDGTARQLFIVEGGVLVWDDPDNFDIRHTAPIPQTLHAWFGQVGIDV